MRALSAARWATYALAITACLPALADKTPRSLSTCTSFDQMEKGDDALALTVHNACTIPVDCSLSWRVVCAPESKKRRSTHLGSAKLALTESASGAAEASAATCGDDGWTIDSIEWSCQPNKE